MNGKSIKPGVRYIFLLLTHFNVSGMATEKALTLPEIP